ncbi:MAG: CapA family protein, partial [Actinomycetota bacterium]|nr:CapA family protein [Actinomycetota bacterium]
SDVEQANEPVKVPVGESGQVVIASVGSVTSGIPARWAATGDQPGVALLPDLSEATATAVAKRILERKHHGDITIASVHWGSNWSYEVEPAQIRFAHRLIDEGVDVVHGHSSHHPRPVEVYRGKLILYGCGDTVDDYEGIGSYEAFRHELRLLYFASIDRRTGRLTELRMTAMRMRRMRLEHAPGDDAEWLRVKLEHMSRPFGTAVRRIGTSFTIG